MSHQPKVDTAKIITEAQAGWHTAGRVEAICASARELLDHADPADPNAIENLGHLAFLLEAGAEMSQNMMDRFGRIEDEVSSKLKTRGHEPSSGRQHEQ